MRLFILLTFGLIYAGTVQAQVGSSISADGTAPNTNAMLDVQSPATGDGKGLLIPRFTQAQRTSSSAALAGGLLDDSGNLRGGVAQGLIVYQTDGAQGLYFNTSQTTTPAWVYLGEGGYMTNYLARTGGTMSGALNMGEQMVTNVSHIDFNGNDVSVGRGANGSDYGTAVGKGAVGIDSSTAVGYLANGAQNSVAVGYDADGGFGGAALGYKATGFSSGVAVGNAANGSDNGTAVGYKANGTNYGTAIGRETYSYDSGVAVGAWAKGYFGGVAMGYSTEATNYGVAIGYQANGAQTNVAIGAYANAKGGTERIAIGHNVTNIFDNSTCIRGTLYMDGGTGVNYRAICGNGSWSNKAFTIDHPLDPANKVLRHFCLEGPQVWNVYAGNVQLVNGQAKVELPKYYEALNLVGSEIYSLTPIGGWAPIWIHVKVADNTFVIAGQADLKVSWTIKVLRNDPGCLEDLRHRPVEQLKSEIR